VALSDPDAWMRQSMQAIAQGKTDDFAREILRLLDKPDGFDALAGNMRVLSTLGSPAFTEKVIDSTFGSALRRVVFVNLYKGTDYVYFQFVLKKNRNGFAVTDFKFKSEPSALFPAGFGPDQ
jgi:hypothetical protein